MPGGVRGDRDRSQWAQFAAAGPQRSPGAQQRALEVQLRVAPVQALFALQIEAAKEIQRYWFERWRAGEAAPAAPDLRSELRPALLALGDDILEALSARTLQSAGSAPIIPEVVGLSQATAQALGQAIASIERYPDRLSAILDAGVLRVGTTGDYQPFSWRLDDGRYTGVDIAMAETLAMELDVELVWVTTSWPTLMADLRAGRFDVAMSGVSRTVDRSKAAYFTDAYYVGGKTAISRCADAARFSSLEAIDKPGIRVVVNPGGTNERFVDQHIKTAQKVLHPDNRTVFAELVAGRADVMFTDAIEVAVHTSASAELCRSVPGLLSFQQKGYLLPVDERWRHFLNLWLQQRQGDGFLSARFAEHGIDAAVGL